LGFFTHATLQGKLFLQELWASEKDWDEKLEEEIPFYGLPRRLTWDISVIPKDILDLK